MSLLDRIFGEKKYRIKVVHWYKNTYAFDYSYSRIIPIWRTVYAFYDFGIDHYLSGFIAFTLTGNSSAEEYAKTELNTIEKINEFKKRQKVNEIKFYERRIKYLEDTKPTYKEKEINLK